jgi:hypothetical protein
MSPTTIGSTLTSVPDPLAGYHGLPLISESSTDLYIGRVILELGESSSGSRRDSSGLSICGDAADGDPGALVLRVAHALPNAFAGGMVPRNTIAHVAGLLPAYQGRPILGSNMGATYLGRVIFELWGDSNGIASDSSGLAFTSNAVNGNDAALLSRIVAALPDLVAGGSPF